ncbi:hypothetical protein CRYUN_Cryun30bG0099700 [Craigia yunnanensis]
MLYQEMADQIGRKIGSLIETDHKSRWGKCLRIRVNMDVTKSLRRFVMLTGIGGREDWWRRLTYERMPMFCYECGIIGRPETECSIQNQADVGSEKVMQYGEWLSASPVGKRFNRTYGENYSRSNRFSSFEANVTSKQRSQKTQADEENGKKGEGDDQYEVLEQDKGKKVKRCRTSRDVPIVLLFRWRLASYPAGKYEVYGLELHSLSS